ncbi:hypothetical protein KFE25_011037 [Diacronema lutheri]|uniref:Sel1 repeat family protein n=1 Tax=Diacronema lutheri TaxID=2081491 RepID=A0A8J5XAQ3_DIALT|nr:hypothetical protein KFE25_011037 [Diacronema lutheri]
MEVEGKHSAEGVVDTEPSAEEKASLGECAAQGRGVARDLAAAARFFRLAAEQSHVQAQYELGGCLLHARGVPRVDQKAAARLFRLAADKGHAHAQQALGACLMKGQGVAQDLSEAERYFRLAAEQGNAKAQSALGWTTEQRRAWVAAHAHA